MTRSNTSHIRIVNPRKHRTVPVFLRLGLSTALRRLRNPFRTSPLTILNLSGFLNSNKGSPTIAPLTKIDNGVSPTRLATPKPTNPRAVKPRHAPAHKRAASGEPSSYKYVMTVPLATTSKVKRIETIIQTQTTGARKEKNGRRVENSCSEAQAIRIVLSLPPSPFPLPPCI